ncbi:MAG: hypothetical protein R3D02_11675 [Hyphomicrobiales bacterium]
MAKGAHSAAGEAELPSGTGRRGVMRYLAPGVFVLAFISAISTFLVLTGLTPIMPTEAVVVWALAINGVLIASMTALIVRELWTLWIARRRRRAASGLHVRVVTLFSLVAAIPAILVAAAASVTLERGLDRWFSERTQSIIGTSLAVAQAYVREHSHALRG